MSSIGLCRMGCVNKWIPQRICSQKNIKSFFNGAAPTSMGKSETPFSLYATERVQKKDARVHFYTEQVKGVETVTTCQQESSESSNQSESSQELTKKSTCQKKSTR